MSGEEAALKRLVRERKFIPGGRYLYASGRDLHQVCNCALYRCADSREGWADLMWKATMSLMTGAGIGVDYSSVRSAGSPIKRTGGEASGPVSVMEMVNEAGRRIQQGGHRRSAIWAGLSWSHPDIDRFLAVKDWDAETVRHKAEDYNFPAALDMTNISVQLDDRFFAAYKAGSPRAHQVYRLTCEQMLRTAEPGFSVDIGPHTGETLRNACTEVTSRDDSDICNLGSINLARIESLEEMREVVALGTLFLLAGSRYSHVPHEEIARTRDKNRRLGLGLMGVHEWLLQRGKRYGPDDELHEWLMAYTESTRWARHYADLHEMSVPIATRSVAPTGTIGIIGETTTGMEPILSVAYMRRYKEARAGEGDVTRYQYVVDPTAKRIIDAGAPPEDIEDAYSLTFERRLAMQAFIQSYVDQGVSSTVNLPEPITDPDEVTRHADILYEYLPKLRGVTCYPNGSRGGQPITPVPYEEAVVQAGVEFTEQEDRCRGAVCAV